MDPAMQSSWDHLEFSPLLFGAIHRPAIPVSARDDMICGPRLVPLLRSPAYDPGVISDYITLALNLLNTNEAYGLFTAVTNDEGIAVPTLIFGIPAPKESEVDLPPTPYNLPISIREDMIVATNQFTTIWDKKPIHDFDKITIDSVSVGIEGNRDMAGSFGGFFKDTSFPDNIYGITAAQCVPGGDIGSPVCSPSTVELNIRLKRLLPHTSLCPPTQQRKFNDAKDTEAKSLLQRFRFLEEDSGTTLRSPTFQFPGRTGILLGRPVGRIVSCELGTCEQGLYRYDQKLAANNHEIFAAMCSWKTTMDWSIFSIDAARYGGNIYDGEIIEETGFLYPGAHVEKIGRSTGPQDGVVNGYFLQRWHSSQSTHEIAIVSNGGAFAELGDAGGCVFEKSNEGNKAAGIVIGTNRRDDFTLATPLDLILTSAPQYTWA